MDDKGLDGYSPLGTPKKQSQFIPQGSKPVSEYCSRQQEERKECRDKIHISK
jgi:hypothetical protein